MRKGFRQLGCIDFLAKLCNVGYEVFREYEEVTIYQYVPTFPLINLNIYKYTLYINIYNFRNITTLLQYSAKVKLLSFRTCSTNSLIRLLGNIKSYIKDDVVISSGKSRTM